MNEEMTPEQFHEVSQELAACCQALEEALDQAIPQLAAIEDAPMAVVEAGLQKARNVIDLMTSLAAGGVEQLTELIAEVNSTVETLWPDGVEAIDQLEAQIGEVATAVSDSLPPCDGELTNVSDGLGAHVDAIEQDLLDLGTRIETAMTTTETAAHDMLNDIEHSVEEHAGAITQHTSDIDRCGNDLVTAVQSTVVTPVADAVAELRRKLGDLGAEIVRDSLQEVKSTVDSVADKAKDAAADCFEEFDDAVEGFCDQLSGRGDEVSTKSQLTQELTDLVQPIFEDVVQQVPGVKQIAEIVGVGV